MKKIKATAEDGILMKAVWELRQSAKTINKHADFLENKLVRKYTVLGNNKLNK